MFDYAYLGAEGERETVAVLVIRDRRPHMLFAHVAPHKGLAHTNMEPKVCSRTSKSWDIMRGFSNALESLALRSVQEELKRRRQGLTILENSVVGDSQANGAVGRVVQALGEQVRVLHRGVEARLRMKMRSAHLVLCWMFEYAAYILPMYDVGGGGRTEHERIKGKPFSHEIVECREKVHYKHPKASQREEGKLGGKSGRVLLGKRWRMGAVGGGGGISGTSEDMRQAATVRRARVHRKWGAEGISGICGVLWSWNPDAEVKSGDPNVRFLTQEKKASGRLEVHEEEDRIHRMQLWHEHLAHRYTEECPDCQAALGGLAPGPRGELQEQVVGRDSVLCRAPSMCDSSARDRQPEACKE